jgi:hypothetical protein
MAAVWKCNRSEKKVRPQNKAQNRPARRRIIELKTVLRKFSSPRSPLCAGFFPIGHGLLCGFLGCPSVRSFYRFVDVKLSESTIAHIHFALVHFIGPLIQLGPRLDY